MSTLQEELVRKGIAPKRIPFVDIPKDFTDYLDQDVVNDFRKTGSDWKATMAPIGNKKARFRPRKGTNTKIINVGERMKKAHKESLAYRVLESVVTWQIQSVSLSSDAKDIALELGETKLERKIGSLMASFCRAGIFIRSERGRYKVYAPYQDLDRLALAYTIYLDWKKANKKNKPKKIVEKKQKNTIDEGLVQLMAHLTELKKRGGYTLTITIRVE